MRNILNLLKYNGEIYWGLLSGFAPERNHNPRVGGSNPSSATIFLFS